MDLVVPDGQNDPFLRSNDPRSRSVKTLAMEAVGPDGQNSLFSRSNEPQSSFCLNFPGYLLRP
ncbi:hypothetical protein H5410_052993 [Solanum commersonii]|uniref:Uncharacterized protein n=1 Tax=Solanum commersonii TaxID=4109 RepID=A0A9J5X559_SOLCO|nr:hypothetical protein H5410_052993 [Solanum commersonii]